MSTQSTKHSGSVQLHGPDADAELVSDRLMRLAEDECGQDVAFARRKVRDPLRSIKGDFLDMAEIRLSKCRLNRIQQLVAERVAKRVLGVKAVVNDLVVKLASGSERLDREIADDAVDALKRELPLSSKGIKAIVRDGWITLEGEVQWDFQRRIAGSAVRKVRGLKGVVNLIKVEPKASPAEVKAKIEKALKRSAEVDARNIEVGTEGGTVTLRGRVRSWVEKDEAEKAAWRAPGVRNVCNLIVIDP